MTFYNDPIKKLVLLALVPSTLLFSGYRRTDEAPDLAISNTGTIVALWEDYGSDIHAIFTNMRTLSGAWETEQKISVDGLHSFSPHLFMNTNGDCVAIWLAVDPSFGTTALYGAIKPNTGVWGNIRQLSQDTELVSDTPSASINDAGAITVCWESVNLDTHVNGIYTYSGSVTNGWGEISSL